MTKHHVIVRPTGNNFVETGPVVGKARNSEEAIRVAQDAGYVVIKEGEGGQIDFYDAEDGPNVYSYSHDGRGAFGVTVVAR